MTALLLALIFVVTRLIQIPIPATAGGGYLNLGDSIIAAGSLLIANPLAAFAAGTGSALADLTAGFAAYALPTFLIKAAMALIVVYLGRRGSFFLYALGTALAGLLMIAGYFAFEYFTFGAPYALAAAPFNALQAGVNLVLALLFFRPVMQLRTVIQTLPDVQTFNDYMQENAPQGKSSRNKKAK